MTTVYLWPRPGGRVKSGPTRYSRYSGTRATPPDRRGFNQRTRTLRRTALKKRTDLERGASGADALEGSVLPLHIVLHLLPLLCRLRSPPLDLLLHLPLFLLRTTSEATDVSYIVSPPGGVPRFPSFNDGPLPACIDSKHTTVAVGDLKTFLPAHPRFLTRRGCAGNPSDGPIQSMMDDRRQECGGRKRRSN